MPLHLIVLASGSRANALLLSEGKTHILIDAGLGIRAMTQALGMTGVRADQLAAIFLTHEHTDHVRGLASLLGRVKLPLYASEGTLIAVDYMMPVRTPVTVLDGKSAEVGPFTVSAISVPHDAAEPLAFFIECGAHRIVVATDLGEVPPELRRALSNSTCAVLESNHDEKMLLNGSYPEFLKERILSSFGHLSNAQAGTALSACSAGALRTVVLAHLSDENNDPRKARASARRALPSREIALHVTTRSTIGPFLSLE